MTDLAKPRIRRDCEKATLAGDTTRSDNLPACTLREGCNVVAVVVRDGENDTPQFAAMSCADPQCPTHRNHATPEDFPDPPQLGGDSVSVTVDIGPSDDRCPVPEKPSLYAIVEGTLKTDFSDDGSDRLGLTDIQVHNYAEVVSLPTGI